MLKIDGKYGNINIDGKSLNIEKLNEEELSKYLKKLEEKRIQLINEQNNCLSEIIE